MDGGWEGGCVAQNSDNNNYISDKILTAPSDVYSFGILMWTLLTCHTPFHRMFKNNREMKLSVSSPPPPPLPSTLPPTLPPSSHQLFFAHKF